MFKDTDENVTYVLMEVRSETDYVWHHIQKITAFFAAMQQFAELLKSNGHQVIYIKLNDENNKHSFPGNCDGLIKKHAFTHFQYQLPDEYRVDELLRNYANSLQIPHTVFDTEHFLTSRDELDVFL